MKLRWDQIGEKYYETGDKEAVFYKQAADGTYPVGEAWSGITGFTESPEGADTTDLWADDQKYLSIRATETYGFTITAYAFPVSFMECDGTAIPVAGVLLGQQARKAFGFVIKTTVGNDIDFNDHAYKLHLVYGATVNPSSRDYSTVNDSPEAVEFSWDGTTTPINVPGFKPISCITIDSRTANPNALEALEQKLFGVDGIISYGSDAEDVYVSPAAAHFYERSGTEGSYTYALSTDAEYDDSKTYYVGSGNTYTPATGSVLYKNPSAEGWYERTGTIGSYVYKKTWDTLPDLTKTYVQQIETGGSTAYLPLPAEVLSTMGYTG